MGNAAIIGAVEPALVVLAGVLILGERARRALLVLLALVTTGLLLVMLPELASTSTPRVGDLLILGQAVTGAIYAVLSRRLVVTIAPVPLSLIQQCAGLIALLIAFSLAALAGWVAIELAVLVTIPIALGVAILSGLLQHGAAVWLHLHALKRMPAGTFAMFLALVPVFTLLGAFLVLGEPFTTVQTIGGALIFVAAISAGRMTRPSTRALVPVFAARSIAQPRQGD